jgi:hypothetical protein
MDYVRQYRGGFMSLLLHRAGLILPPGPFRRYNGFKENPTGDGTTVHTYTNVAIGPARSDRIVVIVYGAYGGENPTGGITIGGVPATIHINARPSSNPRIIIASAPVPSGTTANVVCTYGGNTSNTLLIIGCYSLYGIGSQTPVATASDGTATSGAHSVALNVTGPAGIVICGTVHEGFDATWTGAIKDLDNGSLCLASQDNLATETPRTITASSPGNITNTTTMAGASWA